MSAFRRLVQDAATRAGGGDHVQKQADFPARNSGGQSLSEARRQTAELLPRFNDAAERRQAKEAGFSPLLRALAQLSGGFGVGPGYRQSQHEAQGDDPPRRVEQHGNVRKSEPEPVEKSTDAIRALGKDDLQGWVVAWPEGTDPSRGTGGFYAIHKDAPDFPEFTRRQRRR